MNMYEGIFEAHISMKPLSKDQAVFFAEFCQTHRCKAIQIVLARGINPVQPMSCSRHQGTLPSVLEEVKALAQEMEKSGFEVKRLKIEASPQNKDIPHNLEEALTHPAQNYFEHHWKILLSDKPSQELLNLCERFQAHFSKNAFKKQEDHQSEHFITLRLYGQGLQETQKICQDFEITLQAQGIPVLQQITEYCVYDDYLALDDHWLTAASPCIQCTKPCTYE
ncbi:MAG: hypothetical protein NW226_21830 [Microscillaceae bacterium]|nr:hypothetical protein [Microscillaceae bacterium]